MQIAPHIGQPVRSPGEGVASRLDDEDRARTGHRGQLETPMRVGADYGLAIRYQDVRQRRLARMTSTIAIAILEYHR